eukprot:Tbor_TRINITY_DN5048_c1_g1::TRINITY_DN5048_c1_g1_i1::g.14038::m.14038
MAAIEAIDSILDMISCALTHPQIPTGNSVHRRRNATELIGTSSSSEILELYPILYEMYSKLDAAKDFREPVNALQYGIYQYYQKIEKPMSLRTILDRMVGEVSGGDSAVRSRGTHYGTTAEILDDVSLIWANCEKFNGPDSPITTAARVCEKWLLNKLEEVEDRKLVENKQLEQFEVYFGKVTEEKPELIDTVMDYMKQHHPEILTKEDDVDPEKLTVGVLKSLWRLLEGCEVGQKRPRS